MQHCTKKFIYCLGIFLTIYSNITIAGDISAGNAAFLKGNYSKALKIYSSGAQKGSMAAQTSLGLMYSKGLGTKQNYTKALKYYILAAKQGYPNAQYNIGVMFREGKGVNQDNAEAVRWYKMAASQGLPDAQNNLAFMYINGLGIQRNIKKALLLIRKASAQGNTKSQYTLGTMYRYGIGVKQNYLKAYMWFTIAAKIASEHTQNIFSSKNMTKKQISVVKQSINSISQMMTTEQITKANYMVLSCINSKYKQCE